MDQSRKQQAITSMLHVIANSFLLKSKNGFSVNPNVPYGHFNPVVVTIAFKL
jgi:hypothetical protein